MPPDGVPCGVREPECNQHGRAREAACAQGSLALASGRLRGVYKPPHGERASAPRQGSPDCAQLWRYSPEPVSARGCALQARARRAASRRRAPLDGILPGQTGEQGMSEALRFVRGTKALNFCEFFIPNLAHPLIRWVPEEPGSSLHGRWEGQMSGIPRSSRSSVAVSL